MSKKILLIVIISLSWSCDFVKKSEVGIPVARVNDTYLYQEDLKGILPEGMSSSDSAVIVNSFINRWATQRLLLDRANLNLSERQQKVFNDLVSQYRTDLYTKAYLDGLVEQSIDTVVSIEEAQVFYEANKESFKLNDQLLKLRYINLPQNSINLDEIQQRFRRFDSLDKPYLDSIAIQFKSYSLKDSVWVNASQVEEKIPVINESNRNELLKISNFLELRDSLNLYLIKVVDVRKQNDFAPLEYVLPSIEQIVLNKRKIELVKQLENDITKDAIRNKEFEIFK